MGTGQHLHNVILRFTGQDFRPGCKCEKWIRKMNRRGPEWTRKHIDVIVEKLRQEATKRRWWAILARVPGGRMTIYAMVLEAIKRSEQDARPQ